MVWFLYPVTSVLIVFSLASAEGLATDDADRKSTPIELFEQRIMPVFRSPKPSSCVQWHLSI
ncbi:MAG: hypothetical protein GY758_18970 [Fuerstiella sp.]|nr:hypothetical protein [Fuerstiella sp.]MCP4513440.1 hypothetical protein [Fuerstiella sp.]